MGRRAGKPIINVAVCALVAMLSAATFAVPAVADTAAHHPPARDPTAHDPAAHAPAARRDRHGRLYFVDSPIPVPSTRSVVTPHGEFPYGQTFLLHSRRGSHRVLYLDF